MEWYYVAVFVSVAITFSVMLVTLFAYLHTSNRNYTKDLEAENKELKSENEILRNLNKPRPRR